MKGSIRNITERICPNCGRTVVIKELNDCSPTRTYDSAPCPHCDAEVYEDYIVGEFVTELK